MSLADIAWTPSDGPAASDLMIADVQALLSIALPEEFVAIIKANDGGTPEPACFWVRPPGRPIPQMSAVGALIPYRHGDPNSILGFLVEPSEGFPRRLLPFAEVGNGDLIAFDYRSSSEFPDIVYWDHEGAAGEQVIKLSPDFTMFLEGLVFELDAEPD